MKIGLYDPYLDSLSGGEKYMITAAQCLSKSGNEVSLFWDPGQQKSLKEKINWKFGMDVSAIKFYPNIFSQEYSFLKRVAESKKFDTIIVLSDGSIPFVATKLFLHFQTPMEWLPRPSVKTKFKLKRISGIVCNSHFTKSFIDKKFGVKSTVLYPPVDIKFKKSETKEQIILNVGRFGIDHAGSSYKKQEALSEAFIKMVDSGLKNWKLVLIVSVGEKEKEKLEALRKRTKKYPIEITENPSNELLWEFYAKARIYWHAAGFGEDLQKHPDRAEHFGISTVEAMSCGAVPIVINAGGQKEIVSDSENGFLWNLEEELIEKTNRVISDKNLWLDLSRAAKNRSTYFGKERFCKELIQIIS